MSLEGLGSKEKKRTSKGYEYRLEVDKVRSLAKRLGIQQDEEKQNFK